LKSVTGKEEKKKTKDLTSGGLDQPNHCFGGTEQTSELLCSLVV
jgi:hypothetical protein